MRKTILLFIPLLILLTIGLTGCGGGCEFDSDCPAKDGYDATCDFDVRDCVYTETVADDHSTSTGSTATVSTCRGNVPGSNYLVREEDASGKCVELIPDKTVKFTELPLVIDGDDATTKLALAYNNPFNPKKDLFKIVFNLQNLETGVTSIHVNNIKITGTSATDETIVLLDERVDRNIWGIGQPSEFQLILKKLWTKSENEVVSLAIRVDYDYTYNDGETIEQRSGTFEDEPEQVFIWVKPSTEYSCPPQTECNDNNQATDDFCNPQTGFYNCQYTPKSGKCGNNICEAVAGENSCTCVADCGKCSGNIGTTLAKACTAQQQCKTTIKRTITPQQQTFSVQQTAGPMTLDIDYTYNEPLNIAANNLIKLTITLNNIDSSEVIRTPKITEVKLMESDKQLAKTTVNKLITTSGILADIFIPAIAQPEVIKEGLVFDIGYQYISVTEGDPDAQGNPTEVTTTVKDKMQVTLSSPLTLVQPDA